MSQAFRYFTKGIELRGESTNPTDNIEGSLFHNNSSQTLKTFIQGAIRDIVTNSQQQTLTNKTINADDNTISNLEVDNLKSGVLNTSIVLDSATNTQIPSALAVKTYINDRLATQNDANEIIVVPAGTISSTNVQAALQELDTDIQDHLNDTTAAHTASAIANVPTGNLSATTVQAALNELQSDIDTNTSGLSSHLSDTSDAHMASAIGNIPSGNLVATTVQAALNELQTDVDTRATSTALTTHTSAVSGAHAASAISNTPSGNLASTDVQAALNELQSDVDTRITTTTFNDHLIDAIDAHDASAISVIATGNLLANNVQGALEELQGDADAANAHIAATTGVHGIGVGNSVVGTGTSQTLTNKTVSGAIINGTTLISSFTNEETQNNIQSGSAVVISGITKPIVRLTNSGLVSIVGLEVLETLNHGGVVTLVNATPNEITIVNNDGLATQRILTGTDDSIDLAANGCLLLKYDSVSDFWRVIGGTGGGNTVIRALAGEDLTARTAAYISIGASDGGRTSGSVYKLDGSNDNRIEFVGFVKATVSSGSTAQIVSNGLLKGFTGLSVGLPIYLDPNNPGQYTQAEPDTAAFNNRWVVKIGTAISSTQALINPDLAASAFFKPEINNDISIVNNQSSVANVTDLIFDGTINRGFIVEYTIYRKTDSTELAQIGRLRGVFKTVANSWILSEDFSGENAGVSFTITSSGQIQYTSTNLSGTNYSGVLDFKVTHLFEVI